MTGIADALAEFEAGWVAAQDLTPRVAYERTLRVLRWYLERNGRDIEALTAVDLEAFVTWHAASGLADDTLGSRKVAVHVTRIGVALAEALGRPELAIARDRLRALAG